MTREEIDSINGRVQALAMTLATVIQHLPALHGARAALSLKVSLEETRLEDEANEIAPGEITARDSIVETYLDLLSSVAKHGE